MPIQNLIEITIIRKTYIKVTVDKFGYLFKIGGKIII